MKNKLFLLPLLWAGLVNGQHKEIDAALNSWHAAAARADFAAYFEKMTQNAVFIGTDATENWSRTDFEAYAKPHFDKGKAWHFTPVERHIYLAEDQKTAWFDELLDTQMALCRGSGVLIRETDGWKIAHYVLSLAIPNENVPAVVRLKQEKDSVFLQKLGRKGM